MFAPGQNRSVKWHKTRPSRWPSFARYRKNVYARIGGGRTRRGSRGETESCATDGRRAATRFRCASADRQASWFRRQQPRLTRAVARDHPASPSCGSVFAKPDWRDPASKSHQHWLMSEQRAQPGQRPLYTEIKQRKRVEAALKQDIIERRKTQEALTESEAALSVIYPGGHRLRNLHA